LKRVREVIATGESPLLERRCEACDEVLNHSGEDFKTRLTNLGQVVVKSNKGNPLSVIREIKEQINWLEEANRAHAKPPAAHAPQLMHPEAGDIGLRETISQCFVSGVKGAKKDLLQTFVSYKKTLKIEVRLWRRREVW
jgi:hypothetical protein